MARDEGHLVTQWKQLVLDGCNQAIVIATRKIGTTNRALKKYITHLNQTAFPVEKHHMPRGMTRTVHNFKLHIAKAHAD